MDEFPTGTNVIIAVLPHTGYEGRNGIILNEASIDRGLFRGHIYQTEVIDLSNKKKIFSGGTKITVGLVDEDGLPYIGQIIHPKKPRESSVDAETSVTTPSSLNDLEDSKIVENVTTVGSKTQKANVRTRQPRIPAVGDRFSSRHGLKGACSFIVPETDMPFSGVNGIQPDITICPDLLATVKSMGMLLESIAAKEHI